MRKLKPILSAEERSGRAGIAAATEALYREIREIERQADPLRAKLRKLIVEYHDIRKGEWVEWAGSYWLVHSVGHDFDHPISDFSAPGLRAYKITASGNPSTAIRNISGGWIKVDKPERQAALRRRR